MRSSLPETLLWEVSALSPLPTGPWRVSSASPFLILASGPILHPFQCIGPLVLHVSSSSMLMTSSASCAIWLALSTNHLHPVRDAKDLSKWSSHSLRVGACVALHAMGFSVLDIQWILRWRSTAFMVYLRNVAILAIRQHQALDRAATLPFL